MPTLLAVIPHPDDESYSFGGTIALAARAGWRCVVACASSGEKGKRHDGGSLSDTGSAREAELAASCSVLGAQPPRFWRLPDGGLAAVPDGRAWVEKELIEVRPELVLALGADGAYGHPDHIAVHRWVQAALRGRELQTLYAAFPRGLFLPQYEKCISMMGQPPSPAEGEIGVDSWDVDVDVLWVREAKLSAIAAHRSQLPGGEPEALFPPGLVAATLTPERFVVRRRRMVQRAWATLAALSGTF